MKKLILAASLIVGAAFASFAGVQINTAAGSDELSFTFTADGSYGLFWGWNPYNSPFDVSAFGYYYLSDPTTLISGTFTGNNGDYFNSLGGGYSHLVDIETGYLGSFNIGDTIGLWAKFEIEGAIYTTTQTGLSFPNMIYADASFVSFQSRFLQFTEMPNPNGEPLPGVLAALAIGGCAFLGRKIRKSIKK